MNNAQIDNGEDIDAVMQCIILKNIAILIQKHPKVYGNTIEMNWL